MMLSSLVMLLMAVFPDTKLPEQKKERLKPLSLFISVCRLFLIQHFQAFTDQLNTFFYLLRIDH